MKKYFFIFLLGAFTSLSMAPTNFWPALFVGLSGVYICVTRCKSVIKSGFTGFIFSLGYFGFSLSWVGNALLVEGNPYWWVWPIAISGLPLILSLFTAFACSLHKCLCKNNDNFWTYLSFCFFISASEYARGHLFTGFPWNLYGYTWIEILPVAQIASIWNIYLLTAVTIIWAVFPAFIVSTNYNKAIKSILSCFIILSFVLSYKFGISRIENYNSEADKNINLVVIQPNIKQSEKWKLENREKNFTGLIEQSYYTVQNDNVDKTIFLIIWPETAIGQDVLNSPWAIIEIGHMLSSYPAAAFLITGALRYTKDTKTFNNSMVIFNNGGKIINTYDKSHLVPFGEYMPLSGIIDIAPIVGFKGFKRGKTSGLLKLPDDISIGAMICYEIIFPKYAKFNDKNKPDILVNVTNDAWYGISDGPYQHLVQTQFRAIESGIPIVRSANTGISAIITPTGSISSFLSLEQKGTISQKMPSSID